jgi:hypothetical protein
MRSLRVPLGALVLSALFAAVFAGGYALAASTSVSLTKDGPQPESVTVDWNDTVVFSNADTVARSVVSQRAPFDSGPIAPGATWQYVFEGRAGRYSFIQTGTRPNTSGVVILDVQGKVTLRAGKTVVPYGSSVALTGTSSYPGTPVVVEFRPGGAGGDWATALTLNAGAAGAYAGALKMAVGGRLRALVAAGQVSSSLVSVDVLPRIQARVSRARVKKGQRIVVTGRIVPAGAAVRADLEERLQGRSNWQRKASKPVSKNGTVTFVVAASAGRSHLRLSLSRGSLEPGYVPTVSRALLVVGT